MVVGALVWSLGAGYDSVPVQTGSAVLLGVAAVSFCCGLLVEIVRNLLAPDLGEHFSEEGSNPPSYGKLAGFGLLVVLDAAARRRLRVIDRFPGSFREEPLPARFVIVLGLFVSLPGLLLLFAGGRGEPLALIGGGIILMLALGILLPALLHHLRARR